MEPYLSTLIHTCSDQTGFIKGRYAGKNTYIRLIEDVMEHAKLHNIP